VRRPALSRRSSGDPRRRDTATRRPSLDHARSPYSGTRVPRACDRLRPAQHELRRPSRRRALHRSVSHAVARTAGVGVEQRSFVRRRTMRNPLPRGMRCRSRLCPPSSPRRTPLRGSDSAHAPFGSIAASSAGWRRRELRCGDSRVPTTVPPFFRPIRLEHPRPRRSRATRLAGAGRAAGEECARRVLDAYHRAAPSAKNGVAGV